MATEVAKQVYIAERLAPPDIPTVRQAYQTIWDNIRNVQWWKTTLETGEWKRVALYALEAYGSRTRTLYFCRFIYMLRHTRSCTGIFQIGQMIGRRHIVGYKLREPPNHH